VIAALLDGSDSARINSELLRGSELVAGAGAWYDAFKRGDSLFVLSATPNLAKGKTLEEVENALWQQLERFKTEPVTEEELARARVKFRAEKTYARDSISAQASLIGRLTAAGLPWEEIIRRDDPFSGFSDLLGNVKTEAIQKAAQRFFTRERSTTVRILPLSKESTHD